jgi:hypothetical protein
MKLRGQPFRLVVVFLLAFVTLGQTPGTNHYTLGRKSLVRYAAPTLAETTPIRFAISNDSYLDHIGGVAFDQTAVPNPSIKENGFKLTYVPSNPDGQRLLIEINGAQAIAPLADWQLVPIAKFASTDQYAVVTAAGSLTNQQRADKLREGGALIVNYHAAFDNTLLGLRLLQLDSLLALPDSVDLPKLNGKYILGLGEKEPNLEVATNAYDEVHRDSGFDWSKNGYLISDHDTSISFSIRNNQLLVTGQPRYTVWEKQSDGRHIPEGATNEWLATHISSVRGINPAVWSSGLRVMRYAALFRYCRKSYPEVWVSFYDSVRGVDPEPRVWTPTAIVDTRDDVH